MPRLIPAKPKDLLKLLIENGFVIDRQKGSHIILINPHNNKRAVLPMHTKELPIGTHKSILKQAGIL